ncbi:MAG: DUF885 domain-containing protein [Candidatus Aminicenantes bacterium]|nr:MAG: DUF885 domain-containing protein [Candidatus Aminicenantes bacterium]
MELNKRRIILSACLAICIIFLGTACKKTPQESEEQPLSRSSEILKEVADDYWNFMLEESIYLRIKFGLKIEELPDITFPYAKYQTAFAQSILDKLKEIKIEELSHEESITFEILKWDSRNSVESLKFYSLYIPVTPYASPIQMAHRIFTTFEFKEKGDCGHYLNLLKKYPLFIESIQTKLEEQFRKSIIVPREELDLVIPFLSLFIKEGSQSQFYVKDERLEVIDDPDRNEFQQDLVRVINSEVKPALENLVKFIKADYRKKAPDAVGLWQYPEGREYYKYLVRVNTTLELSPEEIHEIGLEHVKKDNAKLDEIRKTIGFKGTLDEFRHFLKTDSRFFPKTPEEIGDTFTSHMNAMSKKIDSFFLRKPKAPYGVKRLDPELEGSMTFGYYQAPTISEPKGYYLYNGSNLNERSLVWAEGLIYHELAPGHHFHIALQYENEALPEFRRENSHNAYTEGWAEYASWLGKEMGLYQDSYSLCGRYMMDMFLSTRLVVDTGMNYLEWPRSRAVKFMKAHLLESATQIHSESLRYSTDIPAQALGYKLGSIKMFELRDKVERALGDKFDIRKFHDAILGSGSMPIPILERHIDWFIEKELASSKK